MMNKNHIFSIIIVLTLFLVGANCRKKKEIQHRYPEDPATTTLTPRERLSGAWKIYDYSFKESSILNQINAVNNNVGKIEDVNVSYDYSSSSGNYLFIMTHKYFATESTTAFNTEDPNYIEFYGSANFLVSKWFITPFKYNSNDSQRVTRWDITKLYGSELNIILNTDSGQYKLFFNKQ